MFRIVPGGFIPAQDKQYLSRIVQLPNAASLDRTEAVVRQMSEIAMQHAGRRSTRSAFPGLSANGFVNLDNAGRHVSAAEGFRRAPTPRSCRRRRSPAQLNAQLQQHSTMHTSSSFRRRRCRASGTTGGFKLYVQDRAARGYDELAAWSRAKC